MQKIHGLTDAENREYRNTEMAWDVAFIIATHLTAIAACIFTCLLINC